MSEDELHEFWTAIQQGQVTEALERCRDQPSVLQAKATNGHGVVRMACDCQHFDLAGQLADAGAPVGLFEFIALGDGLQVSRALDAEPGRIHSFSHDGWTPLHLAGFFGHDELVTMLLDRGAEVSVWSTNPQHNQPLHATLAGARPTKVVAALLDAGADPAARYAGGITPLHLCAARGDRGLVDLLLSRGAEQSPMDNGDMPADLARQRGFPELAAYLESLIGE